MYTRKDDVLLLESTLTSRGQTTIPSPIRKALDLGPSDKIRFTLSSDNTVTLTRATPEPESDPLIAHFLAFLERDTLDHPVRIQAVTPEVVARARSLVAGIQVDLDALLDDDDE